MAADVLPRPIRASTTVTALINIISLCISGNTKRLPEGKLLNPEISGRIFGDQRQANAWLCLNCLFLFKVKS
jgi:hypothetical protein